MYYGFYLAIGALCLSVLVGARIYAVERNRHIGFSSGWTGLGLFVAVAFAVPSAVFIPFVMYASRQEVDELQKVVHASRQENDTLQKGGRLLAASSDDALRRIEELKKSESLLKARVAAESAASQDLAQRADAEGKRADDLREQNHSLNDRVARLENELSAVARPASGGGDPLAVAQTSLVAIKRPTADSGSRVAFETVYREVACARQDYEVRRLVCPSDGGLSRTLPALPSPVSTFYCPSASPVVYSSAPPLSPATTVCPSASARLDVGGWTQ